ncbi:MAG: hypothetical protein RI935_590 [Candidatus Parcubacteria bacterium]|jgi:pyruvate kinase
MLFFGLYWGEGSKNSERKFVFTNSDPYAILCTIKALELFGISKESVVAAVYINSSHKYRVTIVEKFWQNLLQIDKAQLRKTIFVNTKTKKVYSNTNEYYGVLRLMIKKSSKTKDFMMAGIEHIRLNLNK